ncbi:TonB-dependent receptor [Novosphingobium endophyticum]|uniref:TonB-dependent receptor n=1 Tax=Novosphingobium endophyticum TaxID=1955250 RepID=A0A916TUU5_9SPHN|nr:TonB-dependent receptor [Novosphingobium endophyticum]GGC10308.1 TonB-dependent receptor [Novosphingobium endophyticum]
MSEQYASRRAVTAMVSVIALATGMGMAAPAIAQDSNEDVAASEPRAIGGNEIIVTARRREESLQDTPVAISAFSAEMLAQRQVESTQDLEKITPNLQFKPAGQLSGNTAATVVFIRGIGQLDPTAAVDPGVGIYLDEVYLGRAVGGAIDFGDIADVQVLRGPQGTLFGRNTIGGAVLVRTREPDLGEWNGRARLRTGTDDLYEGFAALNIPLGEIMAARVSGGFRKRDGYVRRIFDGRRLGNDDTYSFGGSIKVEPSSDFSLVIRGDYNKRDENGAPFVFAGINEQAPVPAIVSVAAGCPGATIPFAPVAPGDPRFGAPNVPQIDDTRCANDFWELGNYTNGGTAPVRSTSEVWGLSATAIANVTENFTFKSITAYRSTKSRGVRDADNTPFEILTTDLTTDSNQFSQELQAQFSWDTVNAILGGYYFREETFERASVPLSFPPSPPVIGRLLAGGPGTRDLQLSRLTTDSLAAFGEVTVKPMYGLEVSGGLRYTTDRKTYRGTVLNLSPSTLPDPDPLPTEAIPDGGPLFIFPTPNRATFSAVTGSASVQYRWNSAISTYVSYSRSFKSGGFNTRYNAPPPGFVPVPFDEEKVESYEVGAKLDFGDVRLNLAAFRANYDDIQLIFRQGVVPLLFNAGKARMQGIEAEFSYRPAWGLILDAGLSTLDDEILSVTEVPGATATIAPGDELPLTPSFQGNFGIAYPFALSEQLELTPRFEGSYTSSLTFITGSVPEIEQDAYFLGNASLTLRDSRAGWKLSAGVQNLFDKRYLIQGNASLGTLGYAEKIYARARNWYAQVSYEF